MKKNRKLDGRTTVIPDLRGKSYFALFLLLGILLLLLSVAVFSSLQPNQPGVLQVDVDVDVVVTGTLVVGLEVVDVSSSRHPHHPGVLHVEVRLRVFVVVVDVDGGEVAVLLLFPSTSFQSGQSTIL